LATRVTVDVAEKLLGLLHIAIALALIKRIHRIFVLTVLSPNIAIVCVVLTLAGFIHAEIVNGYPVINPDVFSIY
jgi:hypothetical protein